MQSFQVSGGWKLRARGVHRRRACFHVTWLAISLAGFAARADDRPDFLRDIRPILAGRCFTCHGPDAKQRQAELRLDQKESATSPLPSGATAIVPKSVDQSELIRRIESEDPDVQMPPPSSRGLLTPAEKLQLRRWIETGAEFAEHWAYRIPQRPVVPSVSDPSWIRNPIDGFVLHRLDREGLAPSPPAGRATRLRRWSLDLLGLPPTVDDLEEFLADDSPDADERAVDRLLASPHYGEKLAQDWLDLARFGDTSGYQDDNDRPNSPYRDVVINAFNGNLPFDQLTVESLAGDLLPNPTIAQKILSGFNRLHRYNEEGGSDLEEFRIVYAVDRTNTTAAAWMGLTFGCAQCHDHKYDPLSQREYYQFLAFFNSLKGEITVSKGPANPPQIRVPTAADQTRIDELSRLIAAAEPRLQALEAASSSAFEAWLQQPPDAKTVEKSTGKLGVIGGIVARTAQRASYADHKFDELLSLETPLRSSGRITVVKTIDSDVEIGHFLRDAPKGTPGVGISVAEGPRFFAHLALPDGTVIHSAPIAGEHGVEYEWRCGYDPAAGKIEVTLSRGGKPAGATAHQLTAEQRASGLKLNAFGISFRGLSDQNSPITLYLDDVDYTVSADGKQRTQNFDQDPLWIGDGNQTAAHKFGYEPFGSTAFPDGLSIAQLLALPVAQRSEPQVAQLRQFFLREHAPDLVKLQSDMSSLKKERETREQASPLALVWEEMESPRPTQILARGDYLQPTDLVERGTPAIFPPLPDAAPRDRLALARWLVDGKHPLTARVVVNRYWKQAFGAGLVRTPEDFGLRGELPTHPELLDWLAVEFQTGGPGDDAPAWDLKRLLRKLVASATYRQSSDVTRALRERDHDNRLLARGARFRLTAEEIRDSALTASGLLTRSIGGRSVYPYQPDHFYRDKEDDPNEWKWPVETGAELYRRGLYTFIRRTSPYPTFQTFDVSGRGECTVARSRTNTPLQALVTLNDPVFFEAARVLAEKALSEAGSTAEDRLLFLVRSVLSRSPTEAEQTVLLRLFQTELARYQADPQAAAKVQTQGRAAMTPGLDATDVAAWTMVANAVFNLDEAITRE